MARSIRFIIFFAVVLICVPHIAASQTPFKKVLVLKMGTCCEDIEWEAGEETVLGELGTLDVQTIMVPSKVVVDGNIRHSLHVAADGVEADVALRLIRQGNLGRADILSWNRNGRPVLRQLRFQNIDEPEVLSTAVLQIVEVVLAGMVDVPPIKAPPKQTTTKTPKRSFRHLGVQLSTAGLFSPGGVGPQFSAGFGLRFKPGKYWSVVIDGTWAPLSKNIKDGELAATLDMALLRGFAYVKIPTGKRVHPAFGLGGGSVVAWTQQVDGNTRAKDWVGYMGASILLRAALSDSVWLVWGGKTGLLLPELKFHFGTPIVATYGRPVSELFLALEVMFL